MDEREITIVKGGRETPFSRGILAQTLAQAGARAELAHQIASEVRAELLAEQVYTVEEEEVLARVRDKLVKKDAFVVGRLDKWRVLQGVDRAHSGLDRRGDRGRDEHASRRCGQASQHPERGRY